MSLGWMNSAQIHKCHGISKLLKDPKERKVRNYTRGFDTTTVKTTRITIAHYNYKFLNARNTELLSLFNPMKLTLTQYKTVDSI